MAGGRRVRNLRGSKVLANRACAALREQRSSKKLGVSSFLDFQGAWYALFYSKLQGFFEQLRVARSSLEFLGAPHSE